MMIRELMSSAPEVCTPDTELYYVARKMAERDCGAIPVVESTESMKPIGIVTDRDIVVRGIAKRQNPQDLRASDCMSSGLCTIGQDQDLNEALRTMEQNQIRRLVVVDDSGRCVGMVAQADVAGHASRSETGELVRDISEPSPLQGQAAFH